jgi:hypothetical protein
VLCCVVLCCFYFLCAFSLSLHIYLYAFGRLNISSRLVAFSQSNLFIHANQGDDDILGLIFAAIGLEWMIESDIPQISELFHAMMQRIEDGSNCQLRYSDPRKTTIILLSLTRYYLPPFVSLLLTHQQRLSRKHCALANRSID